MFSMLFRALLVTLSRALGVLFQNLVHCLLLLPIRLSFLGLLLFPFAGKLPTLLRPLFVGRFSGRLLLWCHILCVHARLQRSVLLEEVLEFVAQAFGLELEAERRYELVVAAHAELETGALIIVVGETLEPLHLPNQKLIENVLVLLGDHDLRLHTLAIKLDLALLLRPQREVVVFALEEESLELALAAEAQPALKAGEHRCGLPTTIQLKRLRCCNLNV